MYETPTTRPPGHDRAVLAVVGAYAVFNVTILLAYAASLLGPVPFDLIFLFLGVSGLGVVAALPICLALRGVGVTWRGGLGAVCVFAALILFNYWVLYAASAAV